MHDFTDEELMRFADGELDDATSARIEAAMEGDDALVARVGMFVETRALAKEAMRPLLDEPAPAKLTAAVEAMIARNRAESPPAEPISNLAVRQRLRRIASDWRALPIAASIAAVAGGLAGYALAPTAGLNARLQIAQMPDADLSQALNTIGSGHETRVADQRFKAIASFKNAEQQLCREFELDSADKATVVSVACWRDDAWHIRFAVVAAPADGGYAPASSTDALEAYLHATNAGPSLGPTEEREALSAISRE